MWQKDCFLCFLCNAAPVGLQFFLCPQRYLDLNSCTCHSYISTVIHTCINTVAVNHETRLLLQASVSYIRSQVKIVVNMLHVQKSTNGSGRFQKSVRLHFWLHEFCLFDIFTKFAFSFLYMVKPIRLFLSGFIILFHFSYFT